MAPLLAGRGTSAVLAKTVLELGISNGSKSLIPPPPLPPRVAPPRRIIVLPQFDGDECNGLAPSSESLPLWSFAGDGDDGTCTYIFKR